jgi:outer membrane protein
MILMGDLMMLDMALKKTCAAMLLSFVTTYASAENLTEIYDIAKQSDPTILSAKQELSATLELKNQAMAAFMPTIALTGDRTRTDIESDVTGVSTLTGEVSDVSNADFTTTTLTLSAQQPLFHYENHIAWRQVGDQLSQAKSNYTAAEQSLVLRTMQSYFDVLAAMNNLEFSTSEKDSTKRHLDQTKKRYQVGLIAKTDVSEAQARYDLAIAEEIAAENNYQNKLESLREITNQYHENLSSLKSNLSLQSPEPNNIDEWAKLALQNNPSVLGFQKGVEAARKQIKLETSNHFPTADLVASWVRSEDDQSSTSVITTSLFAKDANGNLSLDSNGNPIPVTGTLTSTEKTNTTLAFGVQFTVPIFSGFAVTSKQREARFKYKQALSDLDKQRRTVVSQTRQAFLGVKASLSRIKALKQAVKSNKSRLKATESGYKVGTRTIVEVLDAQKDYHRAQRDRDNEQYNYIIRRVSLKQAAGNLSSEDLFEVNGWLKAN